MSKPIQQILIKQYAGSSQWFLIDLANMNTVCNHGFDNVDAAIAWVDQRYPEANTRVVKHE